MPQRTLNVIYQKRHAVSSDIHQTPRSGFKNKVQPRFLRPTSTSWISDETLRIVFYIASQINNNLILEEIQR